MYPEDYDNVDPVPEPESTEPEAEVEAVDKDTVPEPVAVENEDGVQVGSAEPDTDEKD